MHNASLAAQNASLAAHNLRKTKKHKAVCIVQYCITINIWYVTDNAALDKV